MSFLQDDEDDDDFGASQASSSKLASLFATNTYLENEDANASLKFVPPKQPKKAEIPASSGSSSKDTSMNILHALPVNAYKFDGGKYQTIGCIGCALVGNLGNKSFKLVLYTGKQKYVCFADITQQFAFIVQPKNYCTFYDNNKTTWSLLFDDGDHLSDFCKKIAFFKAQIAENQQIICQDVRVDNSDAQKVESDDSIELRYKAWTVEERNKLGVLFDSSESSESKKPFRMKLSSKSSKWREMLVGLRVGSQRFCLVPISSKDDFAGIIEKAVLFEDMQLIAFEFELIRIKTRETKNDHQKSRSGSTSSENLSRNWDTLSVTESSEVSSAKVRSKSDVLSRVARVGMPIMLPTKVELDDPESAETPNTAVKPLPKPRLGSGASQHPVSRSTPMSEMGNKLPTNSQVHEITSSTSNGIQSVPLSDPLIQASLVFSSPQWDTFKTEHQKSCLENKLVLRTALDKLDNVNAKLDQLKDAKMLLSPSVAMDSAILMASVNKLVDENISLKSEIQEKNGKLEKLNEKMCELLSSQFKGQQRTPQGSDSEEKIRELTSELSQVREDGVKSQKLVDQSREENSRLLDELNEVKKALEESRNADIAEELLESRVKRLMNILYRTLASQLDEAEEATYDKPKILSLMVSAIRTVTAEAFSSSPSSSSSQVQSPRKETNESSPKSNKGPVSASQLGNQTGQADTESAVDDSQQVAQKAEQAVSSVRPPSSVVASDHQVQTPAASEESKSKPEIQNTEILKWKPRPPTPPTFNYSDSDDEDSWLK